MSEETETLYMKVDPVIKKRLGILAQEARRSMTAHVSFLVDEDWERKYGNHAPTLHPADLNPGMPIDCNPT